MKKFILVIFYISLCLMLAFSCSSCKSNTEKGDDERIAEAITIIKNKWNDVYESRNIKDRYLEITNTKLINIKQNDDSVFSNIDYIVEFSLQTNFYESAPYYSEIGRDSFVAVYRDGRKEILAINPFQIHIRSNGPTDFSDIIESIENFHSKYDQVINLHDTKK